MNLDRLGGHKMGKDVLVDCNIALLDRHMSISEIVCPSCGLSSQTQISLKSTVFIGTRSKKVEDIHIWNTGDDNLLCQLYCNNCDFVGDYEIANIIE